MRNRFQEMGARHAPGRSVAPPSRDRLPAFLGAGADPGAVLSGKCVMVVGCGAVGRRVADLLARLGVREIILVDPKKYERPECVQTQPIRPSEVGESKAESTARVCKEISPWTRVIYFNGPLGALSPADLVGVDVVVMATDNLLVEAQTGQLCLHLGIQLIHASVHGETMVVQVRVYANAHADSPTPACGFGEQERDLMNAQVRFSCDGTPAHRARPEVSPPPTMSTSSLCSLAADFAMTQLLRLILGLGVPVGDTMLEYCGYTHRTFVTSLEKQDGCTCDHARYRIARASGPLADCSLDELMGPEDLPAAGEGCEITLGGWEWVEVGVCGPCAASRPLNRFVGPDDEVAGACPECGGPLHCQAFFRHHAVASHLLEPVRRTPLCEAGAGDVEWLLIRGASAGVLFLSETSTKP
jgi:molybdopterin/thiamine biosynthesis adenylyltransferase